MDSAFAHTVLDHSPDALLLLAPDGSIAFLNRAAERLFGYPRAQLLGADYSLLLAETSREGLHATVSRVLAGTHDGGASGGAAPLFAGEGRRADAAEFPVEITVAALPGGGQAAVALSARAAAPRATGTQNASRAAQGHSASGRPAGLDSQLVPGTTGILPRLTPVEHDDQLKAAVLRDTLTGLPNGTLFNERLAAALRRKDSVDVVIINVDDFRTYNDMLGRSAADELLVEVASRLRNCIRPHDTVARLGGDEFVVLLTDCHSISAVAKRISDSLYTPARIGGSTVRPAVSMGMASRTAQNHDGAELLRQADSALSAAKAAGKNTWLEFRPEMLATPTHQSGGETGLRQAVELGQISVHYQPVVSPASVPWSSSRRSPAGSGTASWCRRTSSCRWPSRAD
ncbi:diguanylate cyclase domain-containing protein [Pseudarthrobacter sp. L19]|uniref:diguanylate cyclase domain-containing protein n=1 Tax=Pseudarthrobacter sp. L19 TaxID=3423951 RepID=UPI003D7BE929